MQEPKPWGGCDGVDPEGNVFQIVKARADERPDATAAPRGVGPAQNPRQ
jgi:hypothetical protein